MSRAIPIILLPVILFLFSACNCTEGEGPVVSENRDISGFSAIELQISGDVVLIQDSAFEVRVSAQENLLPLISTEVSGDKLKISTTTSCIRSSKKIRVEIRMPELEGTYLSGSGNITTGNSFKTDDLKTTLSGSGNIKLDVVANSIDSRISGSGNISLNGTTRKQEIGINGSGDYKAFDLISYEAEVSIKGSGSCEIFVHNDLDAKVSGSGSVYYKGNPDVSTKISGSGNVSRH